VFVFLRNIVSVGLNSVGLLCHQMTLVFI